MDHDDIQSPILGRRQILVGASALSLITLARAAAAREAARARAAGEPDVDFSDLVDDPTMQGLCVLTPSLTQGPFYLPLNLMRQDITEGQPGLATRVHVTIVRASDCTPIPNAVVDLWHNNAPGDYSGFAQKGTSGQTWLRGIQTTDANGLVLFDTIYPGWYPGRTTHMHVKVRPSGQSELTSQMYFKQRLSTRVYGLPAYVGHGQNPTTNQTDGLYRAETLMDVLSASSSQLHLGLTIGVA